eukprot:TRINITY_DN11900_c0_g2_i1.p1 TRINITY_DN11900_c0_g2~~TRINITY_DN11900_c0_g2_i1.p1  ORF type:complete len:628 (-),score=164.17 TRINITY_DN11900_c0_g2_i1:93-1976(-)
MAQSNVVAVRTLTREGYYDSKNFPNTQNISEFPSQASRNVDKSLPSYQPMYEPSTNKRIIVEEDIIRGEPGSSANDRVRERELESEYQRRIAELQDLLRQREDLIGYQEGLNDSLRNELNQLQNQLADLRGMLSSMDADRRALNEELRRLNTLILTQQSQLEEWRSRSGNEEQLLMDLAELQDELKLKDQRDADRLRQIQELEAQNLELRKVMRSKDLANERTINDFNILFYKFFLTATEMDRLSRIVQELTEAAMLWESKYVSIESSNTRLQKEYNDLIREHSRLQLQVSQMTIDSFRAAKRSPPRSPRGVSSPRRMVVQQQPQLVQTQVVQAPMIQQQVVPAQMIVPTQVVPTQVVPTAIVQQPIVQPVVVQPCIDVNCASRLRLMEQRMQTSLEALNLEKQKVELDAKTTIQYLQQQNEQLRLQRTSAVADESYIAKISALEQRILMLSTENQRLQQELQVRVVDSDLEKDPRVKTMIDTFEIRIGTLMQEKERLIREKNQIQAEFEAGMRQLSAAPYTFGQSGLQSKITELENRITLLSVENQRLVRENENLRDDAARWKKFYLGDVPSFSQRVDSRYNENSMTPVRKSVAFSQVDENIGTSTTPLTYSRKSNIPRDIILPPP